MKLNRKQLRALIEARIKPSIEIPELADSPRLQKNLNTLADTRDQDPDGREFADNYLDSLIDSFESQEGLEPYSAREFQYNYPLIEDPEFAKAVEDIKEAQLYMVEPTGLMFRYFGCAAGKGANAAKTEVEKILTKRGEAGITCAEAVEECARIMYTIRDPSKDKPFELEMGWLCEASGYTQSLVPSDMVKAAEDKAKTTQDSTSGDGSETTMAS